MSGRHVIVSLALPIGLLACSSSPGKEATQETSSAVTTTVTGQIKSVKGFCLDVYGNQQTTGAAVDIASCNGTGAQTFTFSAGGFIPGPIVNTESGLCLDDVWGGGAVLQMVTCNGSAEQNWSIQGVPTASTFVDTYGHCMDVLYDNQKSGQTVDPTTCNGTPAQVWSYVLTCGPGLTVDANGECTCDETSFPVTATSNQFDLLVAPQLAGIDVRVLNDWLAVSLPAALNAPPSPATLIQMPGVTVSSLSMPSGYLPSPGTWTWSMPSTSAELDVSTTLDATISGQGPAGCGVTTTIYSAPVSIVLVPLGPGSSALKVQSVSVPLSSMSGGKGNSEVSGCDAIPRSDILGQVQSQLESGLQSQLGSASFMSTMLTTLLQGLANSDSGFVNPLSLPSPSQSPPGTTWTCGQTDLTAGAINGVCVRKCTPGYNE